MNRNSIGPASTPISKLCLATSLCITMSLTSNVQADRLRTFEFENFKGKDTLYTQPLQSLRQDDRNTQHVGSLKVLSGRWLLCGSSDYTGDCLWASRDLASLAATGFKTDVGSLRSETVPTIMRQWGDRGPASRRSLVLFGHANYEGSWIPVRDSTLDFSAAHIELHPGSIVLTSGIWRVCTQTNYKGRCLWLTGSAWDLNEIFGSEIRSAERMQ